MGTGWFYRIVPILDLASLPMLAPTSGRVRRLKECEILVDRCSEQELLPLHEGTAGGELETNEPQESPNSRLVAFVREGIQLTLGLQSSLGKNSLTHLKF